MVLKYILMMIKQTCRSFIGKPVRITLLAFTDFLWSFAVLLLSFSLYRYFIYGIDYPETLFKDLCTISGMIVVINSIAKCYHGSIWNSGAAINRIEEIRRISFSVSGAYLLWYLLLFFIGRGNIYPVSVLIISWICTVIGFPLIRFCIRSFMKKVKIGQIRVFIAGAGKTAMTVGRELELSSYYGYEIVGYFDDDPAKRNIDINGKKVLGRVCDAPRLAKLYKVNSIVCCLPPILLPQITRIYSHAFEHVLVIPSDYIMPITAIYPTLIGFVSAFEFQNRIVFLFPRMIKWLVELVLAVFCVILLIPLFAVLAILVKISSPGPVFYKAKRLGFGGREISVFKFRTMYWDAESRLESLLEENPDLKAEWEKKFKLQKDPRVTRIGFFLRKTSLDELPQFINVLRGEMAIIGPRPIVPVEIELYGEAYDFLKRVRPGITGLWQVSGRNNVSYSQRVAMDMFYVMNWSFWLDWYILWKTLSAVIGCKGSC